MYLVSSPDHFHKKTTNRLAQLPTTNNTSIKNKNANHKPATRHKRQKKKRRGRVSKKLHQYDKWIMTRKKIEETAVRREALIKEIAKFLERVLPKQTLLQQQLPVTEKEPLETSVQTSPPPRRLEEEEEAVAVLPSTSSSSPSGDTVFETPKKKRSLKHKTAKKKNS